MLGMNKKSGPTQGRWAGSKNELLHFNSGNDAGAAGAQGGVDSAAAQNKISQTLKSLFAVAENYPELKANQNFLELQRELVDTETKIQATRQFYNTVVMGLNNQIEQFPSSIVANMFGFNTEKMFEINETEKIAPKVKF